MLRRYRLSYLVCFSIALAGCSENPLTPGNQIKPPDKFRNSSSAALTSSLSPAASFNTTYLNRMRRVYAINDAGLVVGDANSNNIATAWAASTGYVTIGGLDGSTGCCSSLNEVNAAGVAVGWSTTTGAYRTMIWNSITNTRSDPGVDGGFGQGINNSGEIVGGNTDIYPYQGYYKSPSGSAHFLPLVAPMVGSYAYDINAGGAIAGLVITPTGWHAATWATSSSLPQDLGTFGGSDSQAWQVNDHGDVVGWSQVSGGIRHAFLWTPGSGMIDLNTWTGSCSGESEAFAVNNLGVIVGRCGGKAVLWTASEGMRYLPVPNATVGGEATDLNDDNEVVGTTTGGYGVTLWTPSNVPPTADAGGPYAGYEGSTITFDGSPSSDPDGDAVSYAWNFGDPKVIGGGTATGVSPEHVYSEDGTYTATLTVTDPSGASATATSTVVISNAAPVITTLQVSPHLLPVGTSVNVSGSFTDAGIWDTHTVSVDWNANGDPIQTAAAVNSSLGSGSFSSSHIYTQPGVYTVEATVVDDEGAFAASAFRYVVVYDPTAGFVTGGGTFESPAGAYRENPALTGNAQFGFVSKYQKGMSLPSGQTEFQFRAGNLDFHSSAYEWLVIAGSKAQYKGTGTINGEGEYGFMITAKDGNVSGGGGVDRLRIKIWNRSSGQLIYDNQLGDADDAAASLALTSGDIVVHSK